MRTFVCMQIFLIMVSISFGVTRDDFLPLWTLSVPSLGAQAFLWFFTFYNFRFLWYGSIGFLSVSFVASAFVLMLTFVRTWRYFYFPVKEELDFALECLVRIPLQLLQLGLMLLQASTLREELRVPRFIRVLFGNMVTGLFFHDFLYAWVLGAYGGWYVVLGFTHFLMHVAMATIVIDLVPATVTIFMFVWVALMVQHVWVAILLLDDSFVLGMNIVYIVALIMYLMNGALYLQEMSR